MCRILVARDETVEIESLCSLISQHPCSGTLVVERCNFADVRGRLSQAPRIDVLVAPVNAGGEAGSGIDLVQALESDRIRPLVIYTTTREGYTSAVYRTEHEYLLLSPYSANEVRNAMDKVLGLLGHAQTMPLALRSAGAVHVIDPHEVQFVQSQGRKVLVSYADGRELLAYAALSDLEKQLPGSFIRCHKSYLANTEHVSIGCHDALTMKSGAIVPVSQRQYRIVRDALAAAGKQ